MDQPDELAPATLLAQGIDHDQRLRGATAPAIEPSTTFARDPDYQLAEAGTAYARDRNPTYRGVEALLARLEGAAEALVFGSGMAAAMAVVQTLAPGDRIVAPSVMYWGLRNWLGRFADHWGLALDLYDAADPDDLPRRVGAEAPKLVWVETPANPTWDVVDIARAAEIAHAAGALLTVDSTVATPILTRPLDLGADIVMHSATKYLNGHSDVVGGVLATARIDETWQLVREQRAENGALLGSFEAWLLHRGMRTLHLRVKAASDNALRIAEYFEGHDKLHRVLYPGLSSHPGHDVAAQQMRSGFGGMLSVRVRGGAAAALAAAGRCRVFTRATSLGGVESLIEHRHSIEGSASPIPEDLLRLSVGIEDVDDLIADLEQALN